MDPSSLRAESLSSMFSLHGSRAFQSGASVDDVVAIRRALEHTVAVLNVEIAALEVKKKDVDSKGVIEEARRRFESAARVLGKSWGTKDMQLEAFATAIVDCANAATACRFEIQSSAEIKAEAERKIELALDFGKSASHALWTLKPISTRKETLDEHNVASEPRIESVYIQKISVLGDVAVALAIKAGMKPPHVNHADQPESRTTRLLNTIKDKVPFVGNELGSGYARMSRRAVRRYRI